MGIRGDKIRNKASGPSKINRKYSGNKMKHHHKRTESMSLVDLSGSYNNDGYKRKVNMKNTKKNKKKHKRYTSQPTKVTKFMELSQSHSFPSYLDDHQKLDRNVILFGSKSRDESIYRNNGHRHYKKKKIKQIKT